MNNGNSRGNLLSICFYSFFFAAQLRTAGTCLARIQPRQWIVGGILALCGATAWAQVVGSVVHVNGTLSVRRADGSTRILTPKAEVMKGDTLSTQKASFAQINFTDGGSASLRPNTTLRIDEYQFNKEKPQADALVVNLQRGGVRSVTGFIGKRGNVDAYKIRASVATIGIRGSSGETLECMKGCNGVTSKSGALAPGLYHLTYTGLYIMANKAGQTNLAPGQFGFVNDPNKPPQSLAKDPGLGLDPFPFTLDNSNPVQECIVL
jgi:FecR protein